jgi:DNA-binding NtrC family response regulator
VKDGLADNYVETVHRDPDGVMWFGTFNGGISMYDGAAWTSLDTRDGLAGNGVNRICQDPDGSLWFTTDEGITRYRRSATPPGVRIVSVTTDQTYRDLSAIPAFTPGVRVTIEYSALDLKTIPEKQQYRCQIMEGDASRVTRNGNMDLSWQRPMRETSFDWVPEKTGTYTFAVQAIDCDLNYSEPATLSLTVQPDPKFVSMQMELNDLRQVASRKYHFSSFIGKSAAIRQVHALMERAIDSGLTVLITGETGTGKELVARAIHHNSPRKDKPILSRNCGAIPRELLTSELFGHGKGAFTGTNEDKMGLFEAASGGTVQLDEIGEMPQDAQVHLLRFLEEREVQRLGENISRHVDVRIIVTTNRNLAEEVTAGRFREDLYYRLSEFPIYIPPLRELREDIPLLAEHFLKDMDKALDGFAPGVFEMLQSYSWPGNVRELRNVIRRATALAEEGKQIQIYHFPPDITGGESLIQEVLSEQASYKELVDRFRRRVIEEALSANKGNRSAAARQLRMDRANLVAAMKRLGIK